MKLEDVKKLSDEELKIKVATCLGWVGTIDDSNPALVCRTWTHSEEPNIISDDSYLPNYPKDLNAMHKSTTMVKPLYQSYVQHLSRICCPDYPDYGMLLAIDATARQRAEAFVLTMEPEQ